MKPFTNYERVLLFVLASVIAIVVGAGAGILAGNSMEPDDLHCEEDEVAVHGGLEDWYDPDARLECASAEELLGLEQWEAETHGKGYAEGYIDAMADFANDTSQCVYERPGDVDCAALLPQPTPAPTPEPTLAPAPVIMRPTPTPTPKPASQLPLTETQAAFLDGYHAGGGDPAWDQHWVDDVIPCESGWNVDPGGHYYGLAQFAPGTWESAKCSPGADWRSPYDQGCAVASWMSQIPGRQGTTAGWPVCWWRGM